MLHTAEEADVALVKFQQSRPGGVLKLKAVAQFDSALRNST